MGFIRKLAVRGYKKELNTMIKSLSQASTEQISIILVYSVWMRAMLEIERNITVVEEENATLQPELHSYPIKLGDIMEFMSVCDKEGHPTKSFALSIWVHTLRSIIRPKLTDLSKKMWGILMTSKPNWNRLLAQMRDKDLELGISQDLVLSTEKHAKAILQCLPPKQLSLNP